MSNAMLFDLPIEKVSLSQLTGEELEVFHRCKNLVYEVADQCHHGGFWYDELVDEGMGGLRAAIKKHHANKAIDFDTTARWWIKCRMVEFLGRIDC